MEEQIDILNENGELTGEIRSRKEVHKLGLWHRANHIWILNSKGELLLQQRAKEKINHGGFWDVSAAGHISAGENWFNSALREIEEELGIKIVERELNYLGVTKRQNIVNNGTYIDNEFVDVYIIEKDIPLSKIVMQESEVKNIQYIFWEKLKDWVNSGSKNLFYHHEEYQLLFDYLKEKFK